MSCCMVTFHAVPDHSYTADDHLRLRRPLVRTRVCMYYIYVNIICMYERIVHMDNIHMHTGYITAPTIMQNYA